MDPKSADLFNLVFLKQFLTGEIGLDDNGDNVFKLQQLINRWSLILFVAILAIYGLVAFTPSEVLFEFARSSSQSARRFEDGPIELFGAICFLGSAIFFFVVYWRSKQGNDFFLFSTSRNIFFLLLAIIFFMGAGEEMSWGQRQLGLETPDWIKSVNRQDELNIHNITIFHGEDAEGNRKTGFDSLLNIDRLFSIFWLSYCVVLSLIVQASRRLAGFVRKLNIPLVPIWLGLLFPLNYVLSKLLVVSAFRPAFDMNNLYVHYTVELKESLFAFLFLNLALFFLIFHHERKLNKA